MTVKKGFKTELGAISITPNTIDNTPDTIRNPDGSWINFGLDNKLHYYLSDSVQHSPTHSAIIDFKATVTKGNGIDLEGYNGKLSAHQITDAVTKACADIPVFETFSWLLSTNVNGDVIRVTALPNEGVRVSDLNPATGLPHRYFFSYNWSNGLPVTEYEPFDFHRKRVGQFLLQRRVVRPNQYFYTVPAYYSAHDWISLEDKIATFHKNNLDTGFFPSVIMEFFGDEPNANEKVALENKISSKFGGASGKKLFTIFSEDGNEPTKITTFNPPDLPNYFEKLMSEISAKIMTSHRIPAILVGIKEVGKTGLGSNSEEIQASYSLYESVSIAPGRNLITDALNDIIKYNNDAFDFEFKEYQPSFGAIQTTKGKRNDLLNTKDNE